MHSRREHGGCIFIDLRDRDGLTQIVFDAGLGEEAHHMAEAMRNELKTVTGKYADKFVDQGLTVLEPI